MGKWAFDLFGALAFELVFEEGEARRRLEREREIRKKKMEGNFYGGASICSLFAPLF